MTTGRRLDVGAGDAQAVCDGVAANGVPAYFSVNDVGAAAGVATGRAGMTGRPHLGQNRASSSCAAPQCWQNPAIATTSVHSECAPLAPHL